MKKWKTLQSDVILDTKYLKITNDAVELPNGEVKEYPYENTGDSVAIVGCTPEKKLILIRQYRYPVDDIVLEFPAGYLDKNEDPEAGAKREFDEETKYTANKLVHLGTFYESYGISKKRIYLFFAHDVIPSKQKLDTGEKGFEEIEMKLLGVDEVRKLILENKIVGAPSCLAYYLAKEKGLI